MPEPNDQLLALLIAADKTSATPMKLVMVVISNYAPHPRTHPWRSVQQAPEGLVRCAERARMIPVQPFACTSGKEDRAA